MAKNGRKFAAGDRRPRRNMYRIGDRVQSRKYGHWFVMDDNGDWRFQRVNGPLVDYKDLERKDPVGLMKKAMKNGVTELKMRMERATETKVASNKVRKGEINRPTYFYKGNRQYVGLGIEAQTRTLANVLNTWMIENNLTNSQLARIANRIGFTRGMKITATSIANYRAGRCCPKLDNMTLLSEATGLPLRELTGYQTNYMYWGEQTDAIPANDLDIKGPTDPKRGYRPVVPVGEPTRPQLPVM